MLLRLEEILSGANSGSTSIVNSFVPDIWSEVHERAMCGTFAAVVFAVAEGDIRCHVKSNGQWGRKRAGNAGIV
jgi:hypothetical protein